MQLRRQPILSARMGVPRLDYPLRGFTLVEMLVAVALVAILMTMFAQIFGMASDILSQQRGLANNDQIERQLRTIFREDLDHRTFRDVTPFATTTTPADADREGYFHITEGIVNDDTDDVLQLTVKKSADEEPYYAHAETLGTWGSDLNQPEFDDELSSENNVGASQYAEITYFRRNGNLYRRVMLIRQPKIGTDPDPNTGSGGSPPNLIVAPYGGEFWNDFDYSSFFDSSGAGRPRFIGTGALVNDDPPSVTTYGTIPISFGVPAARWGFDLVSGQPRRIVTDTASAEHYIGRFTHQETSDPDFDYPGSNPGSNWFDPTVQLNYDTTNGVVTNFNAGTRVSEDILLRNVHSLDIKVWDPQAGSGPDGQPGVAGVDDNSDGAIDNAAEQGWPESDDGEWRDVGHTNAAGFYRDTPSGGLDNFGNNNKTFGEYPSTTTNGNCFDTWHPTNAAGVMPGNVAPYRPVLFHLGPDNQPGAAGVDDDGANGIDDAGERGWPSTDDTILPQPLTLIRIHVRYVDQKSDQMRDVIIIHSLKAE